MGLKDRLDGSICMMCGDILIARPDKLPLCTECSKKMTNQYARMRPDKVDDKTFLRGMPKDKGDE